MFPLTDSVGHIFPTITAKRRYCISDGFMLEDMVNRFVSTLLTGMRMVSHTSMSITHPLNCLGTKFRTYFHVTGQIRKKKSTTKISVFVVLLTLQAFIGLFPSTCGAVVFNTPLHAKTSLK
jgi:hypothetical protein